MTFVRSLSSLILIAVLPALLPGVAFTAPVVSTCIAAQAQPTSATQSPRFEYFRKVLAKGEKANIRELLQFWSPQKHQLISPSATLIQCQEKPWGALRSNTVGDIAPDCRPDVLFSWGSLDKLRSVANTLLEGHRWIGNPNPGGHSGIYATISPAATFNYGPIAIRIKLKSGTAFRNLNQDVPPSMVMYSGLHMNDFLIGDARVIDSWSFGTSDHYDELVEDVLRIESGNGGQGYALRPPVGEGLNRLFSLMITERGRADEASLKLALLQMLQMVVNDQGRIVYQRGSCATAQAHFAKRY